MTKDDLRKEVRAVQRIMDNGTDAALEMVLWALYQRGVADGLRKAREAASVIDVPTVSNGASNGANQ